MLTRVRSQGAFLAQQASLIIVLGHLLISAQEPPADPSIVNSKPYRRWLWWREEHGTEDEREAAFLRQNAWQQIQDLKRVQPAEVVIGNAWQPIGPAPIKGGQTTPASAVSGRVADIAVDPSDSRHWLMGGAQGGIWETHDAGATWKPCTDNAPSLAMGAIAFAPGSPHIVYAGTGEQAFSGDAANGAGLLKSVNGGVSWTTVEAKLFLGTRFGEIKVDPSDADVLVAATSDGVFKSQDGGISWSLQRSGTATDLEAYPTDFNLLYAALGSTSGSTANDAYRSTDAGETWQAINGPWKTAGTVGRIEMALSPSQPNTLYVSVHNVTGGKSLGVWRTSNAWAAVPTWSALPTPSVGTGNMWYNHDLSVDPSNPSIVYLAANHLLKLTGGQWLDVVGSIHVDVHSLAWAGMQLLVGTDGGCWSSLDGGATYRNHNTNLQLTQFYHGAVHPTNPQRALGGTQDNGTARWDGPAGGWSQEIGGDGAGCAFSSVNPNLHWAASYQDLEIQRTLNGGASWSGVDAGIETTDRPFIGTFAVAPHKSDIVITGTRRVYKSTNFFSVTSPTWSTNSTDLGAGLRSFAFAPSDVSDRTYCVGVSGGGSIQITTNGGLTWNSLDKQNTLPNRTISRLHFQPNNANILYATLSGFSRGAAQNVFVCTNALASSPRWRNVSPPVDIPANAIAIDAEDPRRIFVGTDLGVWRTDNAGTNWAHMGPETGLPNVEVDDLKLSNGSGRLMSFTHGRGAFVLYAANTANLALQLLVSPTNAAVGCELEYSIFITNAGPLLATGVRVTNQLPSNLTFQSAEAEAGQVINQGSKTVFEIGSLGAGDGRRLKVHAIAASIGLATDTASVAANQPDPSLPNNSATAKAEIAEDTAAPSLVSAKAATDGQAVVLSFNEALHQTVPLAGSFLVFDGTLKPITVRASQFGVDRTSLILSVDLLTGLPPYHVHCPLFQDCSGNRQNSPANLALNLPPVVLLPRGSVWRYLDDGSNQGTTWREPTFDDSNWKSGPARLGYGGDGEVTLIDFGPDAANKHITTYLRREFTVPTPTTFSKLELVYSRDDGYASFLNGKEANRVNLPPNAAFNTPASSTINGADESAFYRSPLSLTNLVSGRNLLAVELHQAAPDSSDLGWDGEVVGTPILRAELVDTDQDGVPDEWESKNGLNAKDANDSGLDADRDGRTNLEEYLAGTDPNNALDFLRLEVSLIDSNALGIQFLAVSNRWYTIERRSGSDQGAWLKWVDVPGLPTNRVAVATDTNGAAVGFYRLVTPSR